MAAIADTPEPPYCAVIFTSVRAPGDEEAYAAADEELTARAREQPGFLGIESAHADIGITVSYWATEEHAAAWKQVAEHCAAQQSGRQRWYAAYRVRVCRVERDYGFGKRT